MRELEQDAIRLEESGAGGRYVMAEATGLEAELTFRRDRDGAVSMDHTFVPPQLRGRGLAAKLVARAVADARDAGVQIVPRCSYVVAEFRRHPEWADLIKR